jgi:uncharacterized OB-fold protein
MATYIAKVDEDHKIVIDKSTWMKENLEVGDYVEVTVRKLEKTAKSGSGGPYSM